MPSMRYDTSTLGGHFAPDEVQRDFVMANRGVARFRQVAELINKQAASGGKTVINKLSDIDTSGGVVAETSTIPVRAATVSQIELVLKEYGVGLSASNFLNQVSQTPIPDAVGTVLGRDAVEVLEEAAAEALDGCLTRYVGTSASGAAITTNGTATATNTSVLNAYHVGAIVDYMKGELKIPFFDGVNYLSICTVKAGRNIKNDPSFEAWKMYGDPSALLDGEVGRLDGVRFAEDTLTAGAADPFRKDIGAGDVSGHAFFLGAEALYELLLELEHVRSDFSDDFGRTLKWAWYAITGFGIVIENAVKWDSND